MAQALGIITAAVQLGVEAILVKPKHQIGDFTAHVTISEKHVDEMEVTDHPVEQGSKITDHAFMRPCELVVECAWSNSPQNAGLISGLLGAATGTVAGLSTILGGNGVNQVRDIYQKLLALQRSRVPFDVLTAKRAYKNMLLKSLQTETDKESANILRVTAHMREVIIATVQVVTISAPKDAQSVPQSTLAPVEKGMKQLSDGAKMNLDSAVQALTPDPLKLISQGALP
jgi:hypothetical protein